MMYKAVKLMVIVFLAVGLVFSGVRPVQADDQEVLKVLKDEMTKKIINSGTLDLYDADLDEVRNLSVLAFPETAESREDKFVAKIDYRDVNSGDIVTIEAILAADGDSYVVEDTRIANVEALKKDIREENDYTDEEIQDFMKNYIEQQVKFTGSLMLFDEERGVMRNLKMTELKPEVRRMGIFYTSPAVFEDVETGDVLGIDVALQYKDGKLELQALRIREFKKGQ